MAHDDQFTAKGPPFNGSGFPRTGFSTIKTDYDFVYGVNAVGETCGVYGDATLGLDEPNHTPRAAPEDGTGVCGIGLNYGVYGAGSTTAGVYGESASGTAGVYGKSLNEAAGVMGLSAVNKTSDPETAAGVGVTGAANGGFGCGVVGLSIHDIYGNELVAGNRTPTPQVFVEGNGKPVVPQKLGFGIGVVGMSGGGTGVFGHCDKGVGVYGYSKSDRGGTFECEKLMAQVRLIPNRQTEPTVQLPKHGKVGDLIVIRSTFKAAVPEDVPSQVDVCSLWLCIPQKGQDPASDESNTWREIQLGAVAIGVL